MFVLFVFCVSEVIVNSLLTRKLQKFRCMDLPVADLFIAAFGMVRSEPSQQWACCGPGIAPSLWVWQFGKQLRPEECRVCIVRPLLRGAVHYCRPAVNLCGKATISPCGAGILNDNHFCRQPVFSDNGSRNRACLCTTWPCLLRSSDDRSRFRFSSWLCICADAGNG